jgi:hypothetical protein
MELWRGVAHDFNNKLGVIIGNADLAPDDVKPSEPLFEYLMEIRRRLSFPRI